MISAFDSGGFQIQFTFRIVSRSASSGERKTGRQKGF